MLISPSWTEILHVMYCREMRVTARVSWWSFWKRPLCAVPFVVFQAAPTASSDATIKRYPNRLCQCQPHAEMMHQDLRQTGNHQRTGRLMDKHTWAAGACAAEVRQDRYVEEWPWSDFLYSINQADLFPEAVAVNYYTCLFTRRVTTSVYSGLCSQSLLHSDTGQW